MVDPIQDVVAPAVDAVIVDLGYGERTHIGRRGRHEPFIWVRPWGYTLAGDHVTLVEVYTNPSDCGPDIDTTQTIIARLISRLRKVTVITPPGAVPFRGRKVGRGARACAFDGFDIVVSSRHGN